MNAHPGPANQEAPGELLQMYVVARYELLRHLRRRRLVAILAILAIVVGLTLGVPPALGAQPPSNPYDFASQFVAFSNILVLLAATFFASDSLAGEFHQKTGYLLFPNPIRRGTIFWGKALAGLFASEVAMSVYYGIAAVASLGVTGKVATELGFSYGLAVLYTASAVGVAFLVSAIMKGTTGATILTFLLFLLIFPIAAQVLSFAGVRPTGLLTFAAGTVGYIVNGPYPDGYPKDSVVQAGPGFRINVFIPGVSESLVVMIVYLAASLLLALILFRRREMTG